MRDPEEFEVSGLRNRKFFNAFLIPNAKFLILKGVEAVTAYFSLRQMNLSLFTSLSAADRQTPFTHPEYGAISVDWVIHQMAGHDRNHLAQLEIIANV